MQIKTITSNYLIPVRRVIIKKSTNNKCQRGCEEKGTSYTAGGTEVATMENTTKVSQKTKYKVAIQSSSLTPGHIPRQNCNSKRYIVET